MGVATWFQVDGTRTLHRVESPDSVRTRCGKRLTYTPQASHAPKLAARDKNKLKCRLCIKFYAGRFE